MAYQQTIVRCYSDFEGSGWLAYDRAFRCRMTAIKSLDWSELNSTLYNLCFAGKAKRDIVCCTCLKHNHRTSDCPNAPSLALGKKSDHSLAFGTKRGLADLLRYAVSTTQKEVRSAVSRSVSMLISAPNVEGHTLSQPAHHCPMSQNAKRLRTNCQHAGHD